MSPKDAHTHAHTHTRTRRQRAEFEVDCFGFRLMTDLAEAGPDTAFHLLLLSPLKHPY